MTTPDIDPNALTPATPAEEKEERKRRWLLLLLLLLLLLCCCVGYFIIRYLLQPKPVAEMLPQPIQQLVKVPPTYKFSILDVNRPVGVAVSPDNQRIYVAESDGERLIKMFDRDGKFIKSFAPPNTVPGTREPKYLAVDAQGRVFMVDNSSDAIFMFDADGNYLDAIIAQDLTISKLMSQKFPSGAPAGTKIRYDGINRILYYQLPGSNAEEALPLPELTAPWAPLGIRFDSEGNLIYTDVTGGLHSVHIIPAAAINGSWVTFNPVIPSFGEQGKNPGQLDFPQTAVKDSKGNFYVSDGSNARISTFTPDGEYKTFFGFGSTDEGLNLPRGIWMGTNDRLHVTDAVGSMVRVYDVSGDEPVFLFTFGQFGVTEGNFSYPTDITLDGTGRLYIADRGNNRIQVWSY